MGNEKGADISISENDHIGKMIDGKIINQRIRMSEMSFKHSAWIEPDLALLNFPMGKRLCRFNRGDLHFLDHKTIS